MPRPRDRAYIEQQLDSKPLNQLQKLIKASGRVADAKNGVVILPHIQGMLSFTLCEEFESKGKTTRPFARETHTKGTSRFAYFHIPCCNLLMTSTWSASVGGGETTCNATMRLSAFSPLASPAGINAIAPAPIRSSRSPAMSTPFPCKMTSVKSTPGRCTGINCPGSKHAKMTLTRLFPERGIGLNRSGRKFIASWYCPNKTAICLPSFGTPDKTRLMAWRR